MQLKSWIPDSSKKSGIWVPLIFTNQIGLLYSNSRLSEVNLILLLVPCSLKIRALYLIEYSNPIFVSLSVLSSNRVLQLSWFQ